MQKTLKYLDRLNLKFGKKILALKIFIGAFLTMGQGGLVLMVVN